MRYSAFLLKAIRYSATATFSFCGRIVSQWGVWLTLGLFKTLAILPYRWMARLGNLLGYFLYQLPSKRKRIVHQNLALCFPDWDSQRRAQVAVCHFRHVVRSYLERSVQWFGSAKALEKLIQVDSAINLTDPDLPRTLFIGFHFVGIEAGSIFLNYRLNRRCGALYQPMTNKKIDHLAKQARARFNAEMISRADSARAVLRMLRKKMPVMLAPDMDYGRRNSVFVPFFGVPACTLTTVSRLAKTGHAQVVPFTCTVLPNYRGYQLKIFEPWKNYPTGDPVADAHFINVFLEEQIRLIPEQYYWVHKRFKTRPLGEPGVYH